MAEPFDAGYCHGRICQLTAGAPVMAFATVPRDDHRIMKGDPIKRQSSGFGERWFCGDCGTPLAMLVAHQPDTIDFTIAMLDDPSDVQPGFHIWARSRIAWIDTKVTLPRQDGFRDHTVGIAPEIAHGTDLI
jgi:hypothetical protein